MRLMRFMKERHEIVRRSSEKGIALVIVLILSAISLAIMAALIYMLTATTIISGYEKRYKTAVEAGRGGADVSFEIIGTRGHPDIANINLLTTAVVNADGNNCLGVKLGNSTANWNGCDKSIDINPGDPLTYDWSFDLGTTSVYRVYTKIVDTVQGNSGGDLSLSKQGVVSSDPGNVAVVSKPYLYTIELESVNAANPAERAKFSILYQY